MSLIARVLEGVQVEWKELGELIQFINAKPHEKLVDPNGDMALMTSRFISTEGKSARYIKSENVLTPALKNDVAMVMSDLPNGRALAKTFFVEENSRYAANQRVCLLRVKAPEEYCAKFLHLVVNRNQQLLAYDNGMDQTHLKKDWILKIRVPVPCPNNPKKSLEIQKKIVAIIDKLTEHTTALSEALSEELKARKQQYEHYREQLFCFDDNIIQHLPLGDEKVGEFQRGKRFVKTDLISEGVSAIHYGEMYTHYGPWASEAISFVSEKMVKDKNLRVATKGDVVIVAAGETIEDIGKGTAWMGEDGVVIHDACFTYKTVLNPKFVAYFTRTKQFHNQIKKHISSGKISAINSKGIGKALIPVPPVKEQERIVSILDKFDTLSNSISEALPKEIELRKKQYEYYRQLLLTFPKDN